MALESIDPVVVSFSVKGLPDVERALDRLTSIIKKAENNNSKAYVDGAKGRVAAAKKATDESIKLADTEAKQIEKLNAQTTKEVANENKKRTRDQERMYNEMFKKIERNERFLAESERKNTRVAQQEAEKRSAIYSREMSRRANVITGSISGTLSKGGMLLGAAAGIGGGFALADIVQKQFAAEKQAALLVNLVTANGKTPDGANVASILSRASQVSIETGQDKGEVMSSMLAYAQNAKGGDFNGIMKNAGFIAKFGGAFGADTSEVAKGLGSLQSQNQSATPEELKGLLLSARAQSVQGVMSVAELVPQLGELGAATASFGGNTTNNQRQLMALMQLGAQVGPHGDAGTYVKDFGEELVKKRDKAEALGVKFDKSGKVGSIDQAISSMFASSHGDLKPIMELLGARGGKIPEALSAEYQKGSEGKTGQAAIEGGVAAVMAAFHSIADAGMTESEMEREHAKTLDTAGARINKAFNDMRETMAKDLEPVLKDFATNTLPKLIPQFEKIIEAVAGTIKFFADNPGLGIGLVIGGAIVKDIALAQIGSMISSSMAVTIAKAAGADAVTMAAAEGMKTATMAFGTGLVGVTASLATLAATALAAGAATALLIKMISDADAASQKTGVTNSTELENISAKIQAGTATPEDIKRGKELAVTAKKDAKDRKYDSYTGMIAGYLGDGVSTALGGDAVHADRMASQKKIAANEEESVQHFENLTKALEDLGGVIKDQFGRVTPQVPQGGPRVWRSGDSFDITKDNPMGNSLP